MLSAMRVTWRSLLAVLGGLLLPVPLVLILASGMFPRPPIQKVGNRPVSPVLSYEERLRLQTYHRECHYKADCEPPLGCLLDQRHGWFYCADSQCESDGQCPEGFTCQPLPTREGGPLVRYCIPPGTLKEGGSCSSIPSNPSEGCEPGLLCGDGWCGRPCQLDSPSSCPEGFFCEDTVPGPACLPTCEGRTCPEGLRCIQDDLTKASACMKAYGLDCQHTPCPEGRECIAFFSSREPGHVLMECQPQCGKDLPACPEGFICERRSCRRPCDPKGPNVCDPGYSCQKRTPQQPWMCQSDL
jgi:hypothetical protein